MAVLSVSCRFPVSTDELDGGLEAVAPTPPRHQNGMILTRHLDDEAEPL
jgi:hypothetical protein